MSSLLGKQLTAQFTPGWDTVSTTRLSPGQKDCYTEPVPHPAELVATAALKHQGGYFLFDPPTKASPLPICCSKRRFHGLVLKLLHSPGTDLFDYQAIPESLHEPEVFGVLQALGRSMGMDAFFFPHLVGEPPKHLIRFSKKNTTSWFDARCQENGWKALYGRKSVKRHINRGKRELNLRFVTLTDSGEMEGWLETLAQLHCERWRFDHLPSPFNEPTRIDQYRAVLSRSCLTLALDGEIPLAMHWGFTFNQILLWHTPLINVRYLEYSPLEILLGGVARHCEENGLHGLDFGIGNEPYKSRFANRNRDVFELFVPVSVKSKVIYCLRRNVDPASLRLYAERGMALARAGRTSLRRALTRVVYFTSPTDPISAEDSQEGIFCEISDWTALVDAFRQSRLELHRYQYNRIKSGNRLLCWCRDGRIVSMGWWWSQNGHSPFFMSENGHTLSLPGKALLYDFSTPPRHRRRGYYTYLLRAILRHYQPMPLIIFSVSTNTIFLKAIRNAGFVEVPERQL